jgi:hypothetical protein
MDPLSLTVALTSLVLSGIAVVVTFLQYGLAETQTSVAKRQAEIAEEQHEISKAQHEILVAERARRASFSVSLIPINLEGRRHVYQISLRNEGDKTATGVDWRVFFFEQVGRMVDDLHFVEPHHYTAPTRNAKGYSVIFVKGRVERPLYAGDDVVLGLFMLRADTDVEGVEFDWSVKCEEGHFPPSGTVKVTLPESAAAHRPQAS